MRRERNTDSDSFDMLLDAMCNTFGGIVFIALLIALLNNANPSSPPPSAAHTAPPIKFPGWIEVCEDCKKNLILIGETAKEIDNFALPRKALENQSNETESTIQERNASIEKLMDEIQKLKVEKKTKILGMPRLHDVNAESVVILGIHNGKLFPVHNINRAYQKGGREFDLSSVSRSRMGGGYIVHMIPGKGWPITDKALQKGGKIETALSHINAAKEFVNIAVSKDSFAEFIKIQKIILQKNLDYNWHFSVIKNNSFPVGTGKIIGQ